MKNNIYTLFVRLMERRLWRYCRRHFNSKLGSEHGPLHWKRVWAFGDVLCDRDPNIDRAVVHAFACLHDVMRESNLDDPQHGPEAAALVRRIRHSHLLYLTDAQVGLLVKACFLHTSALRSSFSTRTACLDAGRMDLPPCGSVPDPERMASPEGAAIVSREDYIDAVWKCINQLVLEKN